jgi:Uma2 family endonuclease
MAMANSEKDYLKLALDDPQGRWEYVCGRARKKPDMTAEHNREQFRLARRLMLQLNEDEYEVRMNTPRVHVSTGSYYLPDVCVVPAGFVERKLREAPRRLEVYHEPMPFVAEVWSPSTGDYDVEKKIPEYQRRGDAEIWRVHPYEKTVTRWIRQPDGSYGESVLRTGSVQLAALPGVTIEIESLFA